MDHDGEIPSTLHKKHNLGNLHPMEVGETLLKNSPTDFRVKRRGANFFQITYFNFKDANQLIENHRSWLPSGWQAYIPNSKVSRMVIGKGIKEDWDEQKIRAGIQWEGQELEITEMERFVRKKKTQEGFSLVPTGTMKFTIKGSEFPDKLIIYKNIIK
uniref:DUF4780 domain-containing protein n=1 Tax=Bracon brevicornis TaxID=1563983 RepID=A0A6V7KH64_9HYME